MVTATHVLTIVMLHGAVTHIAVLAVIRALTVNHIAGRRLQRLRCQQYKNGQENVFHRRIIHFQGVCVLWPLVFAKVPGWRDMRLDSYSFQFLIARFSFCACRCGGPESREPGR